MRYLALIVAMIFFIGCILQKPKPLEESYVPKFEDIERKDLRFEKPMVVCEFKIGNTEVTIYNYEDKTRSEIKDLEKNLNYTTLIIGKKYYYSYSTNLSEFFTSCDWIVGEEDDFKYGTTSPYENVDMREKINSATLEKFECKPKSYNESLFKIGGRVCNFKEIMDKISKNMSSDKNE